MFAIWTIWKTKSKVSWETSCCALFSHDKLYPRVFGHIFLRRGCTWRVILNVLNLLKNWLTWCLRLAGQFHSMRFSNILPLFIHCLPYEKSWEPCTWFWLEMRRIFLGKHKLFKRVFSLSFSVKSKSFCWWNVFQLKQQLHISFQ